MEERYDSKLVDKILDEIEASQKEIVREALFVHGMLTTAPKERVRESLYLNSLFWRLVRWWFQRKRKYFTYLGKLLTLPPGAHILKENTTSFYTEVYSKEKGQKERVEIRVQYSGYDFLEFMTLYSTLKDEEGRKKVIDTTIKAVENHVIEENGKLYRVRDYVENVLGISWSEFEDRLRKMLDASISSYLYEIDNTDGSPLAKHIWLRDQAIKSGDIRYLWLYGFSQSFSLSVMSLFTKIHIARVLRFFRTNPVEKTASKYYRYVGRFKAVIDHLSYHELDAVREMKKKYGMFKPVLDIDEARREFERIREEAYTALRDAVIDFVPPEVISGFTRLPVKPEKVREIGKAKKMEESDLELNLS